MVDGDDVAAGFSLAGLFVVGGELVAAGLSFAGLFAGAVAFLLPLAFITVVAGAGGGL